MRKYGISILLCWQVLFSIAQNQSVEFTPVKAGLSQNTVTDILQDYNGFLWIATRNGLNKYDGANMVTYEFDELDSTSISAITILDIFEDSNHYIWVATFGGGVCRYNESLDSFERFYSNKTFDALQGSRVTVIFEDKNQILWFGTEKRGFFSYNSNTNKMVSYNHLMAKDGNQSIGSISGIKEGGNNNLLVSSWGGGLFLVNLVTGEAANYKHNPSDVMSLSSDSISEMHKWLSGKICLFTKKGLISLDFDNENKLKFKPQKLVIENGKDISVSEILQDSKGKIWLGANYGELYWGNSTNRKPNEGVQISQVKHNIPNIVIRKFYEDNTGGIWVGTFGEGLFKIDKSVKKITLVKHDKKLPTSLSRGRVTSFAEDKNHNVWVGTDGGGVNYWDTKKNTFTTFNREGKTFELPSNAIWSLMVDSRENLWIGTWTDGVSIIPKGSHKIKKFSINHVLNKHQGREKIVSIIEDRKGRIWFSSSKNGLFAYKPMDQSFLGFEHNEANTNSLSSNEVTCLFEDSQGVIWIGTKHGGLNKMLESDGKIRFKRHYLKIHEQGLISDRTINSILEDAEGNLWVGTDVGLFQFNPDTETFKKIGKQQGLPNEDIKAIQKDTLNNLWVSSNRGISKINLNTREIENFTTEDGLQAMEFYRNSSAKLSTGELLFGGFHGFNIFSPERIKKSSFEPKVYLSDFKISNKSVEYGSEKILKKVVRVTKEIELTHNQNTFNFQFGMISFTQNEKNKYAYKLEGYDQIWKEIGNAKEAFFTNIPSGNYTFKVKATNNDGIWSRHQAVIKVIIYPPWYATTWAYIGYAMLLVLLLIWGYQTIINRERLKTELQMEHLELIKMQELDEMKSNFFANISHEFRTPLSLILGPLKTMLESKKLTSTLNQLHIMIRNGESLLNLINQLLDISKLEAGKMQLEATESGVVKFVLPIANSFSSFAERKSISYEISVPDNDILLYFDKEKLEKIVINLLSNAFKYTLEEGRVVFKIKECSNHIVVMVKDEGVGIPSEEIGLVFNRYYRVRYSKGKVRKGTGIGLSLSKELVELHKGRIEVESVENKGTVFRVYLKKGKGHLSPKEIMTTSEYYGFKKQEQFVTEEKSIEKEISNVVETQEDQKNLPLILLIEDNDDIRSYVSEILEFDYSIIESDNGLDGVNIAREQIPDLVITDIMMAGINGFEVCKRIKSDVKTSHIPVIMLTARAKSESKLAGFEHGADYYITKPFDPRLLKVRIKNTLNTHAQIKEKLLNKKTLQIEPEDSKISPRDQAFISQVIAIVEGSLSDSNFTVNKLSIQLNLSSMQLYRKMKGLLGQTVNEFIRSIRLKKAAHLLTNSQMNIAEITYQVGFNDLRYFRDCFKKQFGVTPSEYRVSGGTPVSKG